MKYNFSENSANEDNRKETYYGVGGFILEIIKVFFLALVIITPIRVFLLQPFFVQGASMEPNFEDGEYLIINELGYKTTELSLSNKDLFAVRPFKEFQRGDVIVFRYPKDPKQYFIKRIVGLPKETVEVKNGKVRIYDEEGKSFFLDERQYLDKSVSTPGESFLKLADDEYFVMGDNRSHSHDSRSWGSLKEGKIVGKVLVRAWPINRASIF